VPIQTLSDDRYALRGVFYQRDLAALGSNQARGCNSKALIGIQPAIVMERPEMEGIVSQFLHGRGRPAGQGRDGGMVQVDQVSSDRELIPVLPPKWFRGCRYGTYLLVETHNHHYTYKA